jgi:outer membrane lipoprotein SlyB
LGQKLTDQEGMEYQVQLDRGDLVTMRQGADPMFRAGQRVMVVDSGRGQGRVIADNS